MADPVKHAPRHICYHAEFWSLYRSNRVYAVGGNPKLGFRWPLPIRVTTLNLVIVNINRGEPKIVDRYGSAPTGWVACLNPRNTPTPRVLPCRTWSFCIKWCRHKRRRREPQMGSAGVPPLLDGGVADH